MDRVVMEVIESESVYVRDLHQVVQVICISVLAESRELASAIPVEL